MMMTTMMTMMTTMITILVAVCISVQEGCIATNCCTASQLMHWNSVATYCNILCVQRIATILQCNLRAGERPFYVRARIPQESFNLEFSSRATGWWRTTATATGWWWTIQDFAKMQNFGNHKKYLGGTCPFIRFCWSRQSWRLIHSGLSTCFVCWQSWEYSGLVRPGVSFKRFSWSTPTEQKNKACPATSYPLVSSW